MELSIHTSGELGSSTQEIKIIAVEEDGTKNVIKLTPSAFERLRGYMNNTTLNKGARDANCQKEDRTKEESST